MLNWSVKIKILLIICLLAGMNITVNADIVPVEKPAKAGFTKNNSRKIDAIIIHSVFNNSGGDLYNVDSIVKQFSHYRVSTHYLIARDGAIYRLVDEKDIAYHAGKSQLPDGRRSVNSCSIGIELVTSFTEVPTEAQINALVELIKDIKLRYKIKYVLRHSDIAPERKTDPWTMDWENFRRRLNLYN